MPYTVSAKTTTHGKHNDCKAGWLCLSLLPGESHHTAKAFDIDARTLIEVRARITAIDIPIGLPTTGTRQVDEKARKLLGPMKSSVFPTPVLVMVRKLAEPDP